MWAVILQGHANRVNGFDWGDGVTLNTAELSSVELFEEYKGESETLAGFVLEITKGFPKRGEIIRFKGYTLTVESIDNRRIKQIKIGLPKTAL